MGQPLVMGDKIQGQCAAHQIPNPASGAPQPSPAPLPFSAPLVEGLCLTVTIGGKAVAVEGSVGYNTPPHVGLHASDPCVAPNMQKGSVVKGSATVTAGGKAIATSDSVVTICAQVPGQAVATVTTVKIG
jgi:uncharacterized Zn-binding protein involved in type VI secretion